MTHTSPAMDIQTYLNAQNLGISGEDLFCGFMPDKPDTAICLYDTGGHEQNSKIAIDECSVQVKTRSYSMQTAFDKIEAIKLELQSKGNTTINSKDYFGFWVQTPPYMIGKDESDRFMYTMNLRIKLTPQNKGNRA
jgi:hypothetical protein